MVSSCLPTSQVYGRERPAAISSLVLEAIDFEPHREELGEQLGSGMQLKTWPAARRMRHSELADLVAVQDKWDAHRRGESAIVQLGRLLGCACLQERTCNRRVLILSREDMRERSRRVRHEHRHVIAERLVRTGAERHARSAAGRFGTVE